ncbi:GNAT family N-acetyltransferase [Erysipelothrix inopinata]|uniref:GNAT family N-acetyltransferase n=1 Tax=Erysipelothrix inopinata TaxID=225084 RepID=A0A7G9RX70_9FIRM|nr:GNAT family N-acetyltransferase [Erysipelothrix inopinata]QNN60195.1 GNAT family N-acetyltransferase [Erysipelothrix inopinata]
MIILEYSEERDFDRVELLYRDAQWMIYLEDIERLRRAYQNSLIAFVAYDREKLVGVVRAVGDGETILYIQDIIVHSSSQRKNIGSKLILQLLEKYSHIRQIILLTENETKTIGFYDSLGFKDVDGLNCVAFAKIK